MLCLFYPQLLDKCNLFSLHRQNINFYSITILKYSQCISVNSCQLSVRFSAKTFQLPGNIFLWILKPGICYNFFVCYGVSIYSKGRDLFAR